MGRWCYPSQPHSTILYSIALACFFFLVAGGGEHWSQQCLDIEKIRYSKQTGFTSLLLFILLLF